MSEDDKNNILNRLQQLQTQQTHIQNEQNELIQQLQNLTLTNKKRNTNNTDTQNEETDPDKFQLGETVRRKIWYNLQPGNNKSHTANEKRTQNS